MNFSKVLLFFKWLVWLLFGSLFAFFGYVLWVDPPTPSNDSVHKRVIVDGSQIKGYEKNVLAWMLKARQLWVGDYDYLVFLNDAYEGQVMNDDADAVLKIEHAESMKVNYRTKSIYAENIEVSLLGDRGPVKGAVFASSNATTRNIRIIASSFKYFSKFKKAFLYGDIKVMRGDMLMTVHDEMEVDLEQNIAYIESGFLFENGPLKASANTMILHIDDERALVKGNLVINRFPEHSEDDDEREKQLKYVLTTMKGDELEYRTVDKAALVTVTGNILIEQPDKTISADRAYFSEAASVYGLHGRVFIQGNSLDWLVDSKRKQSFEDDTIRSAIEQRFSVNADSIEFYGNDRRLVLNGNILFEQDDKSIQCNTLVFDDFQATIELADNVSIKKDDNLLNTEKLVYDWVNEVYVIKSGMEAQFNLE